MLDAWTGRLDLGFLIKHLWIFNRMKVTMAKAKAMELLTDVDV